MRTIKKTIEQPIFDEGDLKRLEMKFGTPIGQFPVLKMGEVQRYIVDIMINNRKKEYPKACPKPR